MKKGYQQTAIRYQLKNRTRNRRCDGNRLHVGYPGIKEIPLLYDSGCAVE